MATQFDGGIVPASLACGQYKDLIASISERTGVTVANDLFNAVYLAAMTSSHIIVHGPNASGTDQGLPLAAEPRRNRPEQTAALLELLPHLIGLTFSSHLFTNATQPSDFCEPPISAQAQSRRGVVEFAHLGAFGAFGDRAPAICTNVFIARDVDMAPAHTQAALLSAMADGRLPGMAAIEFPWPFVVLAFLRRPESHASLIPELKERFMMSVELPESLQFIVTSAHPEPPFSLSDIAVISQAVEIVHCGDAVGRFARDVVTACRKCNKFHRGPSPLASADLVRAAKAYALLSGQDFVTPHHVIYVAYKVLRHRLVTIPGVGDAGEILESVIKSVPPPV